MQEQEPTQESFNGPRSSLSALSLVMGERRRSSGAFLAAKVLVNSSKLVSRRTQESVHLTKKILEKKKCNLCGKTFGAEVGKKRHCRRCGEVFCYECCSNRAHLTLYHSRFGVLKNRTSKTQLVCKTCYATLQKQKIVFDNSHMAPRPHSGSASQPAAPLPSADHEPSSPTISDSGDHAGSITNRVRKTRARTLDKYVQTVTGLEESASHNATSPTPPETAGSHTSSKHRRHNTLDDGFRYRLAKKNISSPTQTHRARELRDVFFQGVVKAEENNEEDVVAAASPPEKKEAVSVPPPPSSSSWGGLISSIWTGWVGGNGNADNSSLSTRLRNEPSAFDVAFELEEKALEDALQQSQAQLRESEKTLKESQKLLEKSRIEQIKMMHGKLFEAQENKIKDAIVRGAAIEKQMLAHAKQLETHIKAGQIFDDTDEDDVVDLRDELRSVYSHLDELKVETVFPQCMRWKVRSKVEDGLFVGIRDLDIERIDATFSLKTSGDSKRVTLHVYDVHATVALYEFIIRGTSAKAKVLSRALAPTLNRVEIQATGYYILPLIFDSGGTPTQPASRWIPEREKVSFQLDIKTNSNSAFQLPDSITNWLANSFVPSLIESEIIQALPTRDLGPFLCESRNESLVRGKFQIVGDISPRVWKAPLVGPTEASFSARQLLGVSEEESAVLDYLLRSTLAHNAGFPSGKAASLSVLHAWRLNYAAHSLASLAPMMAVLEKGVKMKIPPNWTLQLLRRVDELAAKPISIQVQLFDVDIDLDLGEFMVAMTGLYLKSVEDSVAKEMELENARKAKKNRRVSDVFYPTPENGNNPGKSPEDVLNLAKDFVSKMHANFNKVLLPMLRDEARTQLNAMLVGGTGGIVALSFVNFLADICLPNIFSFSTVLWQSPEIYEGFVLRVDGRNGPETGEYTFKLNVFPVGEEPMNTSGLVDDEDNDDDDRAEASSVVADPKDSRDDDDAEVSLRNVKMELFPIGRAPGAVHLSIDRLRSSVLLDSLIKALLASAATQLESMSTTADENDQRREALREERRVRQNSHVQTELTRELLIQSRQVVESMWGSFRLLPIVSEDQGTAKEVAGIAGIDPLRLQSRSLAPDNDDDEHKHTKKLLVPVLTDDSYQLHIDVRGIDLALKKVKNVDGSQSMRLSLNKNMRHEKQVECVVFRMRRNLQDVLQVDLLPI